MPALKIGCVVMASGLGRRFGGNKLLTPFAGKPLLSHTLDKLASISSLQVVVVTRSEDVRQLAMQHFPVILHTLPGRNDTVRLGLSHLLSSPVKDSSALASSPAEDTSALSHLSFACYPNLSALDACIFCTGDQPFLRRESILALIQDFEREPSGICRAAYNGTPGNPVLFGREYFSELLSLPEGKGGGAVAAKHPDVIRLISVSDALELSDIDTPEDLARLAKQIDINDQ